MSELARQVLLFGAIGVLVAACGSSDSQDSPPLPVVDIDADSQLVDVGQQYRLDASGSYNPEKDSLEYFWTVLRPPRSRAEIQDHCADDFEEVCIANYSACAGTQDICATNADCDTDIQCLEDAASTSPDCTTGACATGEGAESAVMTFAADTVGPYVARVLVSTPDANNTGAIHLNTYPSLFLLGSLYGFGGTGGALIAQYAESDIYAQGAVSMAAQPGLGNLVLAIPTEINQPGRVLAFSSRDGKYEGLFGETSTFVSSPIAVTFDDSLRLFVANTGGRVQIFDAAGRFIRQLGIVAEGLEEVTAIAISPVTGEFLVVDGRPGQPVRRYDTASGQALGALGTIANVATQAIDLAFFQNTDLFIADAAGDLLRCDPDGNDCDSFGDAASLLAADGPTGVAVNPAASATEADVLVSDAVSKAVIACSIDTESCAVFGETEGLDSEYLDLAFAPPEVPEVAPPPQVTTTTLATTTTTVP